MAESQLSVSCGNLPSRQRVESSSNLGTSVPNSSPVQGAHITWRIFRTAPKLATGLIGLAVGTALLELKDTRTLGSEAVHFLVHSATVCLVLRCSRLALYITYVCHVVKFVEGFPDVLSRSNPSCFCRVVHVCRLTSLDVGALCFAASRTELIHVLFGSRESEQLNIVPRTWLPPEEFTFVSRTLVPDSA
jgi:hypothetical protein